MGGMSTMALAGVQFLFIGATFGAMYAWLAPSGLATWARVLASLLVALLFTVALIALHDIARRRAMIRSVRQPELMDGRGGPRRAHRHRRANDDGAVFGSRVRSVVFYCIGYGRPRRPRASSSMATRSLRVCSERRWET
jgi:hypothetical protein